jgi:hypothetical protein
MEPTENSLEKELTQWQEREKRYDKLGIDFKGFRKLKLEHLNTLKATYPGSKNLDDRLAYRALQVERRKLERQLYPDLLVRLIVRGINAIKNRNTAKAEKVQADAQIGQIGREMNRAGFGSLLPKIEQQLKQGNREFSLPVSYHLNEKERMDYLVHFKQGADGKCQFDGFKAVLSGQNPDEQKRHLFQPDDGKIHSADQAYQLLSGRSVHNGAMWQQFDFNDREANGNYRHKNFQNSYGFDIKQSLSELPMKENQRQAMSALLAKLQNGQRVNVTMNINGREGQYALEANPQKKEISIFEPSGNKVTLQQLKSANNPENKKSNVLNLVPNKETSQANKNSNVRKLEPQKNRKQKSRKAIRR